jgi:hypothetical protein
MRAIDTLAGYILSTAADMNATLAGPNIIGSEVDAVVGGEEIH